MRAGIHSEVHTITDTEFEVVIRKMPTLKQMAAKPFLRDKLQSQLTKNGIKFNLKTIRERGMKKQNNFFLM